MLSVEAPVPPVTGLALNLQLNVDGQLCDNVTLSVNPPEGVTVIVVDAAFPRWILKLVGLADIEKSPGEGAVMVSDTEPP